MNWQDRAPAWLCIPHRQRWHALRTLLAQYAGQLAGIDAGDGDDVFGFKIIRQGLRRAKAGSKNRQIPDNQTGGLDPARFHIFGIDAGIADMRIGQRDDLAAIARIGEDFLITGDRGIEHHFADRMTGRTNRKTLENRPVCER